MHCNRYQKLNSTDLIGNASTRNTIATKLGLEASTKYLTDDIEFLKYLIEREH